MNEPSPEIKVLLFYAVVFDPEEFTPSKHVKTKNRQIKAFLEETRLLKWREKGKALYLSANDSTWRWAGEHLGDPLPQTKSTFAVLNVLRSKLARYMAANGVPLSELFAPEPEPAPVEAANPAEQVRQAYLDVSTGQFDVRVRLRDLRRRLADLDRAQQDETLLGLQREGWLVLYPNDDPQDCNSEDEQAAIVIGDRHRDLVYFHREQHR